MKLQARLQAARERRAAQAKAKKEMGSNRGRSFEQASAKYGRPVEMPSKQDFDKDFQAMIAQRRRKDSNKAIS